MLSWKKLFAVVGCILIAFTSKKAYAQRCRPLADPTCVDPANPGRTGPGCFPCTRWSYNPITKRCVAYTFQGCGGNTNRFCSRALCERTCNS